MAGNINYNIVGYDSSNLKILNDIYIINGSLFMNGKNTIQDTCNYVLDTSNVLSNRLADTSNTISTRITDTSNALSSRVADTSNYLLATSNTLSTSVADTSNYVLATSNTLSTSVADTSNYVLATSNALSTGLRETSNYVLGTSNVISTRITNLNTDNINEDAVSNKKFIVNNTYGNNLTINGNLLVTSNLTVGGTSTILNTDVFTTEVLEITNEGGGDVAFKVTQKSAGIDIIRALNEGGEVFKLTSNGNIGIGTNPTEKLDVNGNMRLNGNILPLFNASSNIGSPAFGWSNIYFTGNLFKGGQLFIASNWDKVANNNINYPTYSVGIGSTTPTQKLDVAGNINIATGSTYKVGGTDISLVPAGSAGKYLIHNGTAWTPADILTLTNITGTLPVASGGTGAISRSAAAKNILPEELASGKYLTYNGSDWLSSDILTLTNITIGTGTALSISKGGTNATSQSAAAINILPAATSNQYLTKGASAWGVANIPPVYWNSSSASTINYSGNVGIGSTNPAYGLDVVNAGTTIAGYRNVALTSGIGIGPASITAIGSVVDQNITIGSKGAGNVILQTNGVDRLTVLGNGNITTLYSISTGPVGIGTEIVSPEYYLDVRTINATIAGFRNPAKTSGIGIGPASITAIGSAATQNITLGSKSTGSVILETNGTPQVTVLGSGNVGIGTATISSKLHIGETTGTQRGVNTGTIILDHDNDGGASSITFRSKKNRTSDYAYIQYQDDATIGGSGESSRLIIGIENDVASFVGGGDHILLMPSGNVGIGNSDPAEKLHVEGNLVTTGDITAGFSDIRLKDEITLIENPLEMISNINGFYYRHNELAKSLGFSDDKREVGLSAQEVQKVLPEIVRKAPFDIARDKDNNITSKSGEDYLTICYERLIPVIVESIKELNNEISKLKKDNEELRRMISLSSINQTAGGT